MNSEQFLKRIMTDVKVKVAELCDDNFTNKGFFGKPWADSKHPKNWGSTMNRTGALANSLTYNIADNTLHITSSLPYANIQNEGGTIKVTAKMKSFFWAMYYEVSGSMSKKKDGTNSNNQRNQKITAEAEAYKAMALLKVGHELKIKQRQFVGPSPVIDNAVEVIIDRRMKELGDGIFATLKQGLK